jgi:hypothetical protein
MTPPTVQFIPAAGSGGNDWDTNEVTRSTASITLNGTTYVGLSFVSSGTELDLIDLTREQTSGIPRLRDTAKAITAGFATDAPYLAIWNATDSDWAVYDSPNVDTVNGVVDYAFVESRSGANQADFLAVADLVNYVILDSYTPGDISGWSDYA